MNTSEIKLFAKECIKYNWGKLLAVLLIAELIGMVVSLFTLGIGALVIAGPLELGVLAIYCRSINGYNSENNSLLSLVKELGTVGFARKKGVEALLASLVISIIIGIIGAAVAIIFSILVGSMRMAAISNMRYGYYDSSYAVGGFGGLLCFLIFVAAIILILLIYIRLSMTMYILLVEEDVKAMDAIRRSNEMVKGNTMRFVKLFLSFIGWFILCLIFFPVIIWVCPYFKTALTKLKMEIYSNNEVRASVQYSYKGPENYNADTIAVGKAPTEDSVAEAHVDEPVAADVEAETKKCHACGAELPAGAKFCRFCGTAQ